jgi:DNA repair protein RecO (recombination protein O)
MRHKYETEALVLARSPLGESNALLTLLTKDVGLIRARAQGLRARGAKLAASLTTFTEVDLTLVRGAEGWRVTGAAPKRYWFKEIARAERARAVRVTGLLLRLVGGEARDPELYLTMRDFFAALQAAPESGDLLECIAALHLVRALGLDAGDPPLPLSSDVDSFAALLPERASLVARVNRGIIASGL